MKPFWGTTKNCENKNLSFFILINYFRILKITRVDKVFCQIDKVWMLCGQYPFLLFTENYLFEHFHSHTSLILFIAWNLPCYLHFASCLFVWLIKFRCTPHPSHHWDCLRGLYVILRGWKEEPWSPELLREPDLKGATSDPSSSHVCKE